MEDLEIPSVLHGFASQTVTEQIAAITALIDHPEQMTPERHYFVECAITDVSLNATVRNEMANLLLTSPHSRADTYLLFLAMAGSARETPTFRDFAVQFLGRSYSRADNKAHVKQALIDMAITDKTRVGGTAIMQLLALEEDGEIQIEDELASQLVAQFYSVSTPIATKQVLLTLIESRDPISADQLAIVRTIIDEQHHPDALVRLSMPIFAKAGLPEDLARLNPYTNHADRLISSGAARAIKAIRTRFDITTPLAEPGTAPPSRSVLNAGATPASLVFEKPDQKAQLQASVEQFKCHFAFSNTGPNPVEISSLRAHCSGCYTVTVDKNRIPPGASGTITTSMDVGSKQLQGRGAFRQIVYVHTTEPDSRVYKLSATIDVPVDFAVLPGVRSAPVGRKKPLGPYRITAPNPALPLNIKEVRSLKGGEHFEINLREVTPNREWELTATPADPDTPCAGFYAVIANYPADKPLKLMIAARIVDPNANKPQQEERPDFESRNRVSE